MEFVHVLGSARRTSRRIRTLMEDLLSAGSIQSGRFVVAPRPTDLADIVVEFEKNFEKSIDSVRAGENDPVIGMRILHQLGKLAKVTGRLDPDRWQLDDVRSESTQL